MKGLRFGSVALLDALGFKGIWSRTNPKAVLRQLRRLKQEGLELQGDDRMGVLLRADAFDHRVICISDTIIVAVTLRGSAAPAYPDRPIYRTMLSTMLISTTLMHSAITGTPPFLFRGCLAAGLINVEGDFLIGPAIDEAAELYEKADGPFLWMTSSALKVSEEYAETFFERIEPNLMIPYGVPMKDGTVTKTLVHNYFGATQSPDKWALTRQKLFDAFGDGELRPDVNRKRQQLVKFLDHVEHIAANTNVESSMTFRLPYWEDLTPDQRIQVILDGGAKALLLFPRRNQQSATPLRNSD